MLKFRLSKVFFYILLVFLSIQTSKVFFTENSFYFGFHAFYNTIFVYLTDLLIFGLILAWIRESWKISHENYNSPLFPLKLRGEEMGLSRGGWEALFHRILQRVSNDPIYLFTLAFWLILAISLIFSREISLGLYGLAKITGYLLVFAYAREKVKISRENSIVFWLILITACFQSLIAIYQYLGQSSLDLTILGEEFLSPGLKGVAKFATAGIANPLLYEIWPNLSAISDTSVVMRGYGTFPHPNVLAGFLFMALIINLYLLYFSPRKYNSPSPPLTLRGGKTPPLKERGGWEELSRLVVLSLSLIILATGLIITFSRLAWAVSFLGILIFLSVVLFKHRPQRFRSPAAHDYFPGRAILILVTLLLALALNLFLFGNQIKDRLTGEEIKNVETSENYGDRKIYGGIARNIFKANPVFGVGLRNFVAEMDSYSKAKLLPHQHQPVHNIYFLVLAEAGIVAFISFVLLFLNIVRRGLNNKKSPVGEMLLIIFFGFLALGFFDHYFFTIQQGSLMFWMIAGMLAAKQD